MDYFRGFENVVAVQEIFGSETLNVLQNLRVEFTWYGYMSVDDEDGHLLVNQRYLKSGDRREIYLDVIHELCHVKQFMDGLDLFDVRFEYVDRPTEIEAYAHTVKEAKRLGFKNDWICKYLETEWMTNNDLKRLAKNIGFKC